METGERKVLGEFLNESVPKSTTPPIFTVNFLKNNNNKAFKYCGNVIYYFAKG